MFKRNFINYPYFENFTPLDEPPTLFKLLDSIINGDKDWFSADRVPSDKIAESARKYVFDFDYDLTKNVNKEDFEINFIEHFLMRRIGMETFNAFKIMLRSRLREILPYYNRKFDLIYMSFEDLFEGDGYTLNIEESEELNGTETGTKDSTYSRESADETERSLSETKTTAVESENTTNVTDDRRHSDTPQSQLSNVQNGSYVTDYNYDQNNGTATGESNETISDSVSEGITQNGSLNDVSQDRTDKAKQNFRELFRNEKKVGKLAHGSLLLDYYDRIQNVFTEFYHDCDSLFYQLWD